MFVMVRMRVHEHMGLPEGFEVRYPAWNSLCSPMHISLALVSGMKIGYLSWNAGGRTLR